LSITLIDLYVAFQKYFALEDTDFLDVVFATALSCRTSYPLWVLMVGPSGRGKTSVLSPMFDLVEPHIHVIGGLTPKTFLSGQLIGSKVSFEASLLLRLPPRCVLLAKDVTSILSLHPFARAEILAQLREIADGRIVKDFGVKDGTVSWEGHIAFIGAVTPNIDDYRDEFAALGERFIYFRVVQPPQDEVFARIIANLSGPSVSIADLRKMVTTFMSQPFKRGSEVALPGWLQARVIAVAQLVAITRAMAPLGVRHSEVARRAAPEDPTRLVQSFAQLARFLGVIRGVSEAGEAEWRTVRRVALNCIPEPQMSILGALQAGEEPQSILALARTCAIPETTIRRRLQQMSAVINGAVSSFEDNGVILYTLTDYALALLAKAPKALAPPPTLPPTLPPIKPSASLILVAEDVTALKTGSSEKSTLQFSKVLHPDWLGEWLDEAAEEDPILPPTSDPDEDLSDPLPPSDEDPYSAP
jgi:hypothetical protein